MVSELPVSGDWLTHNFLVEGHPPIAVGEEPEVQTRSIAGDYFRVMNIPLLAGRDFTPHDNEKSQLVGIINKAAAARFFPNQNPIGKRVRWARREDIQWITVVGVAGDIRHFGLDQPDEPALYTPYAQANVPWKRWMHIVARSAMDENMLTDAVRKKVRKLDPLLPITKIRMMRDLMSESFAARQFNMLLLGLFAVTALLMAIIGIYGVMSYTVAQRTHEIGLRMALGAGRLDVLRLIVGQGMQLILAGLGFGLAGAVVFSKLMSTLLVGVNATDPATYVVIAIVLCAVSLVACLIPARRATMVDPMIALKYE
jgi:putative ABC transport system permease protein